MRVLLLPVSFASSRYAFAVLLANRSEHRDLGFFSQTANALPSRHMLAVRPYFVVESLGNIPLIWMHCIPIAECK